MKTVAQLSTRVLERLERIAEGETPTAQQANKVRDFYRGLYEEQKALDKTYWDRDSIPEEIFEALTDFVAGRIAPDFDLARPDLEASGGMRLTALASRGASGLPVSGSYF